MWYTIITMIFSALVMALTILSLKDRRKRILANQLPGPTGSFIIGNLSILLHKRKSALKNMMRVYRMYEKSLFKVWIFNRLIIILTRPEDIETVLKNSKCLKKAQEYSVFNAFKGIFSNDNINEWRHNRKMVIRGLSIAKLKSLIPVFCEEAKVLLEIFQEKCDSKSNDYDISHNISMATMETIGRTALGVTFNAQRDRNIKIVEAFHAGFNFFAYKLLRPWQAYNTIFYFSSLKRDYDYNENLIKEYADTLIKSKLGESNHTGNSDVVADTDDANNNQNPKSVLDILLENVNEMSREQIRNEIITVIVAGQDTSAFVNACVIFMLAHHQDVQNKVLEELESIFSTGDPNRSPTYEDIQQMTYLDLVIKETLRLYPSAPLFARSLEEDMEIGGYLCPAGSTLLISPLLLQTSKLYYIDPLKFNPDNFLPDACARRHPYAYIPFSGGLRNCIGGKYAILQMKIFLCTLVRKLKFSPSDRCPTPRDLQIAFSITSSFQNGCYVKIEPRMQ